MCLWQRFYARCLTGINVEWDQIETASTPTWLLFDEAQDTLWDVELWEYFKKPRSNVYVVFFGHLGLAQIDQEPDGVIRNTPVYIPPTRRVGLHPTNPGGPCLLFSYEEYQEYIHARRMAIEGTPNLDEDLQEWIYQVSGGHVSAMIAMLALATDVSVRTHLITTR